MSAPHSTSAFCRQRSVSVGCPLRSPRCSRRRQVGPLGDRGVGIRTHTGIRASALVRAAGGGLDGREPSRPRGWKNERAQEVAGSTHRPLPRNTPALFLEILARGNFRVAGSLGWGLCLSWGSREIQSGGAPELGGFAMKAFSFMSVVLTLSSLTAIDARPAAGETYRPPWCVEYLGGEAMARRTAPSTRTSNA